MLTEYAVPPWPADLSEAARWRETRRRERMQSGRWQEDLEDRLVDHFGPEVREAIGPKSLAKNVFRKLCSELSVSYIKPPKVSHTAGELVEVLGKGGVLERVGLWPLMRHVQRRIVGLREMFLRVDWSPLLGRASVRPVRPDVVRAFSSQEAPEVPLEVWELRYRDVPNGKSRWCWDRLSIMDPANPRFEVREVANDGELGPDITVEVLGEAYSGAAYPYRWTQGEKAGQPWLPYIAYHAMRAGQMFDPYEGIEVVEGSLDVAVAYTFLNSDIFHASWPQRWALGAYIAGTVPVNGTGGPRTKVPVSPLSVVHFEAAPGVTNPQIGQFAPGIDVEALARTVSMLERATSEFDGLDASFLVKDTANPWSAAALSITREGKRQAQQTYAPELKPSDEETVAKLVCITNIQTGTAYPEADYTVEYTSLPLSAEEAQLRRTDAAEQMAQGRKSIVDVYVEDHGVTRAQAEADLARIQNENTRWGVRPGTAPTPVVTGPAPAGA